MIYGVHYVTIFSLLSIPLTDDETLQKKVKIKINRKSKRDATRKKIK